ncbi:uncharacterized protein [Clytia hemisphaerica]|uniref:uncharacterized protein n=1 Tax=Clytia hemisphaerica TaxID=252671 RepID=UPI0034D3E6F8
METPQAQQGRARHAQRMRARRANENEQQTQQRRQRDLERARNRRANENEQQTQQRRQRDLERARNRLANENEQTQERRHFDLERARNRLANENEQQIQERRQLDLERARNRLANENEQQTQERRQLDLERVRNARANENEQQTQERRQLDLERVRNARVNENEQQTQQRRQLDIERVRNVRANENEQQTQQRRQLELERARDIRANENEMQGHRRRNIDAQNQRNRRANENIERGRQRRQANVERIRNIRENENEVQIARRRRGDNARHRRPRRLNLAHIGNPLPGEHYLGAFNHVCIGPPTFRICGQICHRYGTLFPNEEQPQYAQLYIIEAAQALDLRMQNPSAVDCNRATMALIQEVLGTVNPYAASFKHMKQVEQEEQNRAIAENRPVSRITMVTREGHDQRRGNAPLHEEVAAIFTGEDGAPPAGRNIVVYPRNHHLQSIPSTSSVFDPYIYPLLFPRGDLGWDMNMPHVAERATRTRNHVTQLEHYVYRLAIRRGFSALHLSGRLFQQFLVDAYTKVEGSRLDFLRHNQQQLRAECYQGLVDDLENAAEQRNLNAGHVIVLPSTFSGSPRAMHQLYLDAMAVVSKHGSQMPS